jgi:hypothetical protein
MNGEIKYFVTYTTLLNHLYFVTGDTGVKSYKTVEDAKRDVEELRKGGDYPGEFVLHKNTGGEPI